MAKSIKFKNNCYIDSSSVVHGRNKLSDKLPSLLVSTQITGLSLGADSTYTLNLPNNTIFVEPLVASDGSQYSGGVFLALNSSFTYVMNNDYQSATYKGIWMRVTSDGVVYISAYKHSGALVKGFRIWYINI